VISQVVANDLCIGCGMCAGVLPNVLRMRTDEYGAYQPELMGPEPEGWGRLSLDVCPFGDHLENEDTIATGLFRAIEGIKHQPEAGFYLKCFVGYVNSEEARMAATSGGIITWLAGELLSKRLVDAVACVGPAEDSTSLFEFQLITEQASLTGCRKSRYYPVEVSNVIKQIKDMTGKVAFVGLPCYLKALHLAMNVDVELRECIGYMIGLVCGHLKTKKYAAYLARHCGVSESQIQTVDFRRKVPGRPANKYAFSVSLQDGSVRTILMREVWGNSWSNNLFMHGACDCCDDVIAETADVVIGDAWLPEYIRDYRGTSIVVCRNPRILELLDRGILNSHILLKEITIQKVIQSQAGAIRQRREGLRYRLYLQDKRKEWHPCKRVTPSPKAGSCLFRYVQRLRIRLRNLSKQTYLLQEQQDGLNLFKRRLRPWIFMNTLINMLRHAPNALKKRIIFAGQIIREPMSNSNKQERSQ